MRVRTDFCIADLVPHLQLCLGRPATECRCDNASIEVMCVGYLQSEIRELVLGTQQPLVPPSSVNSSGFACDEEGRDNLLMLIEELDDIKTNPAENNLTRVRNRSLKRFFKSETPQC